MGNGQTLYCSEEDAKKAGISDEQIKEYKENAKKFPLGKGLSCCYTNPDNYKVVAEIPEGKLIRMTLEPGKQDDPHDHPKHYMYVLRGGKLAITHADPNNEGQYVTDTVEMPTGAPPILPAGPHQVKNVGDTEVEIIFFEINEKGKVATPLAGFISPFICYECGYKKLAEDDHFVTGMMSLEVGAQDPWHSHQNHCIYVLDGDEITLYDKKTDNDEKSTHVLPIKHGFCPPQGIPRGWHTIKNTGTKTCQIVFFEKKDIMKDLTKVGPVTEEVQ